MDRHYLLRRNIRLLRLLRSVEFFMLMIPVLVLYFTAHGLSMQDVMMLQAIFSVTMVLVEVPSGYFSDALGRRQTLIIGSLFLSVGWIAYCFAHDFPSFLVSELILGVGASFVSGTDSAMLYDTMLELGIADQGIREEGRQLSFGNFSEAVSGVIGGLLAGISLYTPLVVQAAVMISLVPISWFLVEPTMHRRSGQRNSLVEIFSIVRRVTMQDHALRWMLAVSSVLGASTLTFVWLLQPWMVAAGIPTWMFGFIWSGYMLIVGISSIHAHKVHARFGIVRIVLVLGALVVLTYALAGSLAVWWLLPVLAVFNITRGVSNPVFTTAINQRTGSHERATVLSVRQLGVRLLFVVAGPFIGWVADRATLGAALHTAAIAFGVLLAIVCTLWIVNELRQRFATQ